jgi:hypothetical protein
MEHVRIFLGMRRSGSRTVFWGRLGQSQLSLSIRQMALISPSVTSCFKATITSVSSAGLLRGLGAPFGWPTGVGCHERVRKRRICVMVLHNAQH